MQFKPRFVQLHRDAAPAALRDVEEDDSACDGLFDDADEPFGGGGVARAEGFEHHGPQPRSREHGPQDLLAHSREEFDQLDASGELRGDAQFRRRLFGLQDRREVVGDVDADFGQRRVVVGAEGAQGFGAAFGGAVGAEKPVLEIERHFGDLGPVADARSGDFDGRDEVLAPVGAQHADRNLASGEDHGFGEIFEHEAQGRCRIGHGVGSVQHDESVVAGVVVADQAGQGHPVRRLDVRRVDHGRHRVYVDVDVEAFQRGEFVVDAAEIEGDQRPGGGIGLHADGPARVDDQNGGSHSVFISLMFRSESSRGETRRCRRSSPRRDSSSSRRRCSCRRVPAS